MGSSYGKLTSVARLAFRPLHAHTRLALGFFDFYQHGEVELRI